MLLLLVFLANSCSLSWSSFCCGWVLNVLYVKKVNTEKLVFCVTYENQAMCVSVSPAQNRLLIPLAGAPHEVFVVDVQHSHETCSTNSFFLRSTHNISITPLLCSSTVFPLDMFWSSYPQKHSDTTLVVSQFRL